MRRRKNFMVIFAAVVYGETVFRDFLLDELLGFFFLPFFVVTGMCHW